MKLICINAKAIKIETKDTIFTQRGTGLIEGEFYETKGELFKDQHGWDCYYIEGLGVRLACRFTKALEQSASISKEKYNFEEALEKALAEEDYEEANRLSKLSKSK